MKTVSLTPHNQDEAAAVVVDFLLGGGTVVLPTDTAYAVAADATNAQAITALQGLKGRDWTSPFSVIVASREQAEAIARFSPQAAKLWTTFMPGPLTLVLPVADGVGLSAGVTANGEGTGSDGSPTVGLRHPAYEFDTLVAERLERPFTATSANRSGAPPAYSPDEFVDTLPDGLAPHCVIDAGRLEIRPVSTVVSVVDEVKVLREGAIPAQQVLDALG